MCLGRSAREREAGQAHVSPPKMRRKALEQSGKCCDTPEKPKDEPPPARLNVLRGGRGEQHPRVRRHTGKDGGSLAREKPAGQCRGEPQAGRRGETRNRARERRLSECATKRSTAASATARSATKKAIIKDPRTAGGGTAIHQPTQTPQTKQLLWKEGRKEGSAERAERARQDTAGGR